MLLFSTFGCGNVVTQASDLADHIRKVPFMDLDQFSPSAIDSQTILRSAFGKAETEAAAMYVTDFLAAQNANWTTEFSYENFTKWVNGDAANVNGLYRSMIEVLGGNFVVTGLRHLIDQGYLQRRDSDDATYFTVMPAFVEVMRRYA